MKFIYNQSKKLWGLIASIMLLSAQVGSAQNTITTTFANNNGSGIVTFNFVNNSGTAVIITEIGSISGSTNASLPVEAYYKTTPVSGAIGTGGINAANGWTQFGSGTISSVANTSTTTAQAFFPTASSSLTTIIIPNGATYGIAVGASDLRYSTLTAGTYTETAGGCSIVTGTNVGYGGTVASPTNHPRGFIGYVNFIPATPCTNPPALGVVAAPDSVCANVAFNLSATGATIGTGMSYQWQSATAAAGPWTNIAGATNVTSTVTSGISSASYFRLQSVCSGGSPVYSNEKHITIKTVTECYCPPNSAAATINTISNVATTGGSTNISQASGSSAYTNYVATQIVSTPQNTSFNLNVTIPASSSNTMLAVWIDWNQDGVFDNTAAGGEKVYVSTTPALSFSTIINVPATALPGNTRMRVRSEWYLNGAPTDPCYTTDYGETEDYGVNVIALTPCTNPPTPGTISGVDSICPNIPFTLQATGTSLGTGLVYQWQSAAAAAGPWTDIVGANGLFYYNTGITTATFYRMRAVCSSGSPVYTPEKGITIKAVNNCYCAPTYATGCADDDDIKDVTLIGATQTLSNLNTPCPATGYQDYTTSTTLAIPDLMPTVIYNGTVTTNYTSASEYVTIWIDYNNDGTFQATEQAASFGPISNTSTGAYTITVPATTTPGIRRMRILLNWNTPPTDPCGAYSYGETHDYLVNILALAPCTNPPSAGTVTGPATICANVGFTLNNSGASTGSGITYQWQIATAAAGPWTDITGATNPYSYSVTGITVPTYYRLKVVCSSGTPIYSNEQAVAISAILDCYCTPTYTDGCQYDDDIDDVTLVGASQTLSNLNTPCPTSGYENYFNSTTLAVADMMPTVTYNGTVTTNYSSANEYVKIWIDYNNDGVFDVATEEAASFGPISNASTGAYTITPPATATAGIRRMRVMLVYGSMPTTPCGSYSYGETHDYKVNILPLTPCTNPPTAGTISTDTTICPNIAFTISGTGFSVGSGMTYQWQSATAAAGPWTDIAGATVPNSHSVTGITAPTYYRLKVVCNTGTPVYSNEHAVAISSVLDCYCTPTYTFGCGSGDDIKDVTLIGQTLTLSNLNTPCPASGYENYTTSTTLAIPDLIQGSTYNGTVTTNYSSVSEYVKIWIDYDNNGVFDMATEEVAAFGPISNTSTGAYTITVPTSATPGIRRMRVMLVWNSSPTDPCGSYSYGETHDYNVQIGAGCTAPVVDLGANQNICANGTFTLDAGAFTDAEYTWSTGATTQTIDVNTPGTYWVSVSTGINCVDSDTIQVGTAPMPSGNGMDVTFNTPSFTFLVAGAQNVTTYEWNFGNGVTSTETNPNYTYPANGTYTVTVTISNECGSVTFTQTITVTGASINKLDLDANALKLYPNPTNHTVTLENESNYKMKNVVITNVLGQQVLSMPVNSNKKSIDISGFTSGLYHVKIEFEEGTVTRKLEVLK